MKSGGTYTVFDASGGRVFQTSSVMQELAPYMAELLDFRLLMTDQQENVLVPPPAYAFAPYYVDQDKSWSTAWKPFKRMYLPRSDAALAEYHSGLKPNEYYVALAERDRLAVELKKAATRRQGLLDAVEHLRGTETDAAIFFNLSDFQVETESLLAESRLLQDNQSSHRAKLAELAELTETRALWLAQLAVARAASNELNDVFESATGHTIDVECPTCGEHYSNDIVTRFNIAADHDALIRVMQQAQEQVRQLAADIEAVHADVAGIEKSIIRIQAILSARRSDLTFGDVVAAEGRNAATRVLRTRLDEVVEEIGLFTTQMEEFSRRMRQSLDAKPSRAIRTFFSNSLAGAATQLDVRVEPSAVSISKVASARGSEGPRSLAAYYYAFLHTVQKFGSSTFCPVVVDAPNQQGQDDTHLPAIIRFLVARRPSGCQLILAVEDAVGLGDEDADILDVGVRRNQLLSDDAYQDVSHHLRRHLAQLV